MDPMARRLLETLDMWEDGVQIMRENLRRRSPDATDAQIEDALRAWLDRQEDPPPGFARVEWPRLPK
jgi:Rv0078B-related antitoxin